MDPVALAPWRDLSIVWFILWMFIFMLIPGAAFFFALKYLRKFNRWLKLPLLTAHVWALRIEQSTTRVSDRIAAFPIAIHSRAAQANVTVRGVIDYLRNG
ncbi:MAG: hypothetical protein HZB51_09530 [Chloroflexi bacterium]|nr:hypothetical protein [Chloroflexota bacterium]